MSWKFITFPGVRSTHCSPVILNLDHDNLLAITGPV